MINAGLDKEQAGVKIVRRNINHLRYTDGTTLMAVSEEELKSLLMKVKEEWKHWLKTQHCKTKIMASGPITSWQINGEAMETVADLFWGAPKSLQMLTAAMKLKDDCSLEKKLRPTYSACWKAETLFVDKIPSSQSYGFSSSHA